MARFKRLTWDDLDNLTREELVPRLEAEQEYWDRKEARSALSEEDAKARREFSKMIFSALNPSELADSMAETTAWIKGESATDTSFWNQRPGSGGRA